MNKQLQIIYILDNMNDVGLTKLALTNSGLIFEMFVIETEHEFRKALINFNPDIILADHSLAGFNSLEAYKLVREVKPGTPFILLTESVSEQFAVDCLLAGIDDYILKSNLIRLPSSIERILSKRTIKEEKETVENLLNRLQYTYNEIELKNKKICDSINYAKRIQNAILPDDLQIVEEFHSGFAIHNPRDIVSGDFCWLAKTTTTDGSNLFLKIIAAIDCTGHGISGAFMSLMVSVLLNETIKNKDINSPADVLTYLNQKLPSILNRKNKENIIDGLDMALCAINTAKRIVYFSGANRPLWVIRKINAKPELLIYKGTKASIGLHTSFDQKFENITIQLEKGDRLFLFTNGITDQFGGILGKKLSKKRLQNMLLESVEMEMQKQKEYINNYLNSWKGNLEQVDDMLLIGIEIN